MSFCLPPHQQINNAPFMKTEQNMKDSIANLLMRSQPGQLFPHLLHDKFLHQDNVLEYDSSNSIQDLF